MQQELPQSDVGWSYGRNIEHCAQLLYSDMTQKHCDTYLLSHGCPQSCGIVQKLYKSILQSLHN